MQPEALKSELLIYFSDLYPADSHIDILAQGGLHDNKELQCMIKNIYKQQ